jgi:hypothetical protein
MGVKRSIAIARMLDDVLPQEEELATEDSESTEQDDD